jgi:hypothetical protein
MLDGVRARDHLLIGTGLMATVAALAATGALAAASKTVELTDPTGDVSGPLDIQRASLSLPSDGRLRAVITVADKIEPKELLAKSGPPGSACLKIWTDPKADPAAARPDRLVCVTAKDKDDLRASVLQQSVPGLPTLSSAASVSLNKSARSMVIRVSQTALGRPTLIRYAVESTRPGCVRVSCVDQVPDKGVVRRFRVRG